MNSSSGPCGPDPGLGLFGEIGPRGHSKPTRSGNGKVDLTIQHQELKAVVLIIMIIKIIMVIAIIIVLVAVTIVMHEQVEAKLAIVPSPGQSKNSEATSLSHKNRGKDTEKN